MQKIIKPGKPQTEKITVEVTTLHCCYCDCIFSAEPQDFNESVGMYHTICPCCGREIDPYTWKILKKELVTRTIPSKYPYGDGTKYLNEK